MQTENTTESKVTEPKETSPKVKNGYIMELSKPYEFDGKKITQIDLSGMKKFRLKEIKEIEGRFGQLGIVSPTPEQYTSYAVIVAALASNIPDDFFEILEMPDLTALRMKVMGLSYTPE